MLERDQLASGRRWRIFWAVVLYLTGALFAGVAVSAVVAPTPGQTQGTVVGGVIFSIALASLALAGATYLVYRARQRGRLLKFMCRVCGNRHLEQDPICRFCGADFRHAM
jgi:hypothetical protein